jgi:hypothetical protein
MKPHSAHRQAALDHLAAVQAHADNLRDEWQADRPNATDVKYLTASIGRGLKLAEIHASLEIGAQLARIADRLTDDDSLDFLARPASAVMRGNVERLVNGR